MAKSTIRKALALLLSAMLVLSAFGGALNVFAEGSEIPDYAGTAENGVTVSRNYFWHNSEITLNDIQNGDFENGLLYWGPISPLKADGAYVATSASDYASVVAEQNGNHYVAFNFGDNYSQWNGLATYKIVVPQSKISIGDNLVVLYDHKEDTDNNYQFRIDQHYTADETGTRAISVSGKNILTKLNGWETAYSNLRGTVGERADTTKDYIFELQLQATSAEASTAAFDNIRLAKVVDGNLYDLDGNALYTVEGSGNFAITTDVSTGNKYYGEHLNYQPYEGTVENGISTPKNELGLLPTYNNADLSNGFMYWSSKGDRAGYASDMFALEEIDGVKCITYKEGVAQFDGISSIKTAYDGFKTGDQIRLVLDHKISGSKTSVDFRLTIYKADGTNTAASINRKAATNGFVTATTGSLEMTSDNDAFSVQIQNGAATGTSLEDADMWVKNIHIVKYVKDGVHEYLYNPDGTLYKDLYLDQFGTEENGMGTTSNNGTGFNNGPTSYDGLENADFSQGFKFWGTTFGASTDKPTVYPSDIAAVKTEANGNKYVTVNSPASYQGLVTAHFLVDEKYISVGDTVSVLYKFRGDRRIQAKLLDRATGHKVYAQSSEDKVYTTDSNGWATAIAKTTATVLERNAGTNPGQASSGTYRWQIIIAPEQNNITFDIDDVKLVKILSDGTVTELDGTPVNLSTGDVYGSEADGFNGYKFNYSNTVDALEAPKNLDFSEGLKYWGAGTSNKNSYFASDVVTLDSETKMISFKNDIAGDNNIVSARFSAKGLAAGDKIYVRANYIASGVNFKLAVDAFDANGNRVLEATNNLSAADSLTLSPINAVSLIHSADYASYSVRLQVFGDVANGTCKVKDVCVLTSKKNSTGKMDVFNYIGSEDTEDYIIADGDLYNYWGTAEKGMYAGGGNYSSNSFDTLETPKNLDFSEGLKYWMAKDQTTIYLSDDGVYVNEAGRMAVVYNRNYNGARTANFYLPGINNGDVIYLSADISSPVQFTMNIMGDDITSGGAIYAQSEDMKNFVSNACTVSDISKPLYIRAQFGGAYDNTSTALIDNLKFLRADRGGLTVNTPKVNLDGTLLDGQLYGDANNDGTVDLRDLVRAKKAAAGAAGNGIFLAAVDFDGDEVVSATDFAEIAKFIIDPNYKLSK